MGEAAQVEGMYTGRGSEWGWVHVVKFTKNQLKKSKKKKLVMRT